MPGSGWHEPDFAGTAQGLQADVPHCCTYDSRLMLDITYCSCFVWVAWQSLCIALPLFTSVTRSCVP